MTDREAFEAWACEEATRTGYGDFYWVAHRNRNGLGEYSTTWVEGAWKGWQAAVAHEREQCAKVCDDAASDYLEDADMERDERFAVYAKKMQWAARAIRRRTKP